LQILILDIHAAVVYRAADTLTVLADGQGALEPLVRVATVTVNTFSHIIYTLYAFFLVKEAIT
jgi:hypothetical protein